MNSFNTIDGPFAVLFSVQTDASMAADIFLFLCKAHSIFIIFYNIPQISHTILHIIERHRAFPPDGRVRRGDTGTWPAQAGAEARVLSALSVRGPPEPVPDRLPPPTHVRCHHYHRNHHRQHHDIQFHTIIMNIITLTIIHFDHH